MALRDGAVALFGVKTSGQIRVAARQSGREHVSFFPVHARTECEVVLGEDDAHLDCRRLAVVAAV